MLKMASISPFAIMFCMAFACLSVAMASANPYPLDRKTVARENDPLNYYISTGGDDSKSGRSFEDAFATIDRCLAEVRSLRNSSGGKLANAVYFYFVNVSEAGSLFVLENTVEITAEESGDGNAFVVFGPLDQTKSVTISGGHLIKNWVKAGNTWTAKLPETLKSVRQLFVNGQRRMISNTGVMQYEKFGDGLSLDEAMDTGDDFDYIAYKRKALARSEADPNFFTYQEGQVPASLAEETGLEAIVYEIWTASVHPVTAIHPSNRTVYLKNPVAGRWETSPATGHRYILQNSKQFLKPGTFHFDETSRVLTYQPMEGETPSMQAIVPRLTELVTVVGSSDKKVANIAFVGLTFAHAAADYSTCFAGECSDQSANFLTTAAIRMEFASNCEITMCDVAHVGGYGVWLDQGCSNNTLSYVEVYDVGAGGVRIGRAGHVVDPDLQTNFNTLTDSTLADGGHIFKEGCGVLLQMAGHNTITHNHIHHFHYTGVSIGWSWGYAATSSPGNIISYNHIHHIGMGDLSDMGCVYSLGVQIGAQVVHNLCHDVWSYGYGGWGYYTDEGSSNMTYAYNIAYHTKAACWHQHYGENNQFINNIFAYPHHIPCPDKTGGFCYDSAIKSSRHPAGSGPGAFTSFNFERNIIYISNGTLMSASNPQDLLFSNQTFDNNVYWNTVSHTDVLFPPNSKSTFAQWQSHGKDKNSVIADPLFLKASSFDFSKLSKDSPALKLGFKPIDTSTIGPRT
ncbi:uncharacterized protein LOC135805110 [Sycon ciliatum]|uniref:uncharacterized protein LOC135805110 n=1 Tax=Sycon ciliatum TaxID=27933 RepID=UPI0031F6383B